MSTTVQTPFNQYVANGVTSTFAFNFKVLELGDLQVSINGVVQVGNYTVDGVGNANGGNISFFGQPANNSIVLISRIISANRLIDYQDNGDLLADNLNKDFDRIWQFLQSINQTIKTALKLPFTTQTDQVITDNPTNRVGKVVSFDSLGNMVLSNLVGGIVNASNYMLSLLTSADAAAARTALGITSQTIASQAEAEAGTDNSKTMTSLRVAQSIAANAPNGGGVQLADNNTWTGANSFNGPVTLGDAGSDVITINGELNTNGGNGAAGQVLSSRGDGLSPEWRNAAGSLINIQVFTANGKYDKTINKPSYVVVELAGGGGFASTSGAAAGGYSKKRISNAALANSETVTIGAGANSQSSAGGTTSFGAHFSATGALPYLSNGGGGIGVGGDLNIGGGDFTAGAGSASYFGGGKNSGAVTSRGAFGSGGNGVAGVGGVCIVEEYA